tara:strand:- start:254 stop:823 length:570 start_codon:yes stop_codon:yes gene_type:complete
VNQKHKLNLKDYIFQENLFTNEFCDLIINEFSQENFSRDAHKNSNKTRFLGEFILYHQIINKKNSYTRKKILNDITNNIQLAIYDYMDHLNIGGIPIKEHTGISFRKMIEGDHYHQHIDDAPGFDHYKISISIALNDDYEGGHLNFFNDTFTIKHKKGDIVMFPSTFFFPHSVSEIKKGTRYQLITWLR